MSEQRLLIVDDEVKMAEFVANVADMEGLVPIVATSARECLKNLADKYLVGIFLDIVMPDMDGIELIKEIGNQRKGIPVVVMSGYSPTYLEAAKTLGDFQGVAVQATLAKPFSVDDVSIEMRKIRDALA